MPQLTLPGKVVKKHNKLIRNRINVTSVLGSRIITSLISCIRADDVNFKPVYKIPALSILANSSGADYADIKSVCRELINSAVEVEMYENDDEPTLILFSFFSSIKYSKGIIEARFNQDIRSFLLELNKEFTKYNIVDYIMLSSMYSQRLFEILHSWKHIKHGYIDIEIAELHRLLDTVESQKKHFGLFKKRVLEPAHKEIIKKTSFYYEWEPIKKGVGKTSPVIGVRFIFAKKKAAIEKTKDVELQKTAQENNDVFFKYINCFKKYGLACEGGHQKKEICEICLKLR